MKYEYIKDAMEVVVDSWGEIGQHVIECAYEEHKCMTMDEFLSHAITHGGNWLAWFASGIKELFPKTYEALPEEMGNHDFHALCMTMLLCGVDTTGSSES